MNQAIIHKTEVLDLKILELIRAKNAALQKGIIPDLSAEIETVEKTREELHNMLVKGGYIK